MFYTLGLTLIQTNQAIQYYENNNIFKKHLIRFIIFARKTVPNRVISIKKKCENNMIELCNKINDYAYNYNTLSEDDKYIVETFIDLLIL
jgi:hypothetical protein